MCLQFKKNNARYLDSRLQFLDASPQKVAPAREVVNHSIAPLFLQVFDTKDRAIFQIGEYGYHPGQLMRPMGVAETINGNYLVSDYELHCVTVYNTSGTYMSRFGQRYLAGPKGITVDSRGRILVVDQKSCMVCIFKPTGKFVNRFGARGSGDNQFGNPVAVAVNALDEIFVSDYALHLIKAFDVNGLYLYKFGVHGLDPGQLHSPTGLVFDKVENLYICDWGNNRIQVGCGCVELWLVIFLRIQVRVPLIIRFFVMEVESAINDQLDELTRSYFIVYLSINGSPNKMFNVACFIIIDKDFYVFSEVKQDQPYK